MNDAMRADAWVAEVEVRARGDFSRHQATVIGPGHWRIRRPDSGQFWADIVVMGQGLAVWGDIEACVFAYHSGSPEELVAWVAGMRLDSYAMEKAQIGMGAAMTRFVDNVAVHDLRQRLKDAEEEFDDAWAEERWNSAGVLQPTPKAIFKNAIVGAIEGIKMGWPGPETHRYVYERVSDVDPDAWEWVEDIGMVLAPRVICAVAAVRRLHELLSSGNISR